MCGYTEIPKGHALYQRDYDQIEDMFDYQLPAHGGLTFASMVDGEYWIGFDCAHLGDATPMWPSYISNCPLRNTTDVYRTMKFVENNIKQTIDFLEEKL